VELLAIGGQIRLEKQKNSSQLAGKFDLKDKKILRSWRANSA
jgi:hypothetical protein